MAARYILGVLAIAFLGAGAVRAARTGTSHPQARAWLLIGTLFAIVSAWQFLGR